MMKNFLFGDAYEQGLNKISHMPKTINFRASVYWEKNATQCKIWNLFKETI